MHSISLLVGEKSVEALKADLIANLESLITEIALARLAAAAAEIRAARTDRKRGAL